MRQRFTLLIVLCSALGMQAQTYEVSGSVRDAAGQPMPYANVLLLSVRDSSEVDGSSADENGRFSISGVAPDLYYLTAKFIGYKSLWVPLEIRSDTRIGALVLEEDSEQLEEAVVIGRQPRVERLSDRLVFNVENTVVSEGNTWDILRNTPGIITMGDNIKIRGRRATVYLNDRKVQLATEEVLDLLKGLSGDMISSVEVIPIPPASFEAADGPVINIRTTQNVIPGYKGNIRAQQTLAVFPKYSLGTSQYYKSGSFSILGNYVFNPRKEFREARGTVNFINPQDEVFARWNTERERIRKSWGQQANLVLEYKPGERDALTLTTNYSTSPNRVSDFKVQTSMRNAQGVLDSTLQTNSRVADDRMELSTNLAYRRELKKEGAHLRGNIHYTNAGLEQVQDGISDYFDPAGTFIRQFSFSTVADQDIEIWTGQGDYYNPIPSGSFEAGIKTSIIRTRNRIDYLDVNNTEPPFDIALSDRFEYDENVYAAYVSLDKSWGSWSLKLGLRAEQTEVQARSLTLDEINNQNYLEWFPSLFLQRDFGEDNSFSLSYSRQLTRPNYSDLNPFRLFLNENAYSEGNPNLIPAFGNSLNLNLSFKNTVFFDFYYRDNGAYIGQYAFQDNENQTLVEISQNAEESVSYGIDFTVSTRILPFWSVYSYNSLFYEAETFQAVLSDIDTFKNDVSGVYAYLGNYLDLDKKGKLTADATMVYVSRFLLGSYQLSETIRLNVGLTQRLWEGRGQLSLVAEDLLGRANPIYTTRYANQDSREFLQPETRFIRLGFTYNFGNYRLQNKRTGNRNAERKRLDN